MVPQLLRNWTASMTVVVFCLVGALVFALIFANSLVLPRPGSNHAVHSAVAQSVTTTFKAAERVARTVDPSSRLCQPIDIDSMMQADGTVDCNIVRPSMYRSVCGEGIRLRGCTALVVSNEALEHNVLGPELAAAVEKLCNGSNSGRRALSWKLLRCPSGPKIDIFVIAVDFLQTETAFNTKPTGRVLLFSAGGSVSEFLFEFPVISSPL